MRRVAYSIAFSVFFIITPILVLYASGYRYDLSSNSVVHVGAVYVKSYPSGAHIMINSEMSKNTTPYRLLNLTPGNASISIGKDGFQPWTKKINILSGETTFIRDIVLFRAEPKQVILGSGGNSLLPSPNLNLYAYIQQNDNSIIIVNAETQRVSKVQTNFLPIKLSSWSADQTRLLVQTTASWYEIDITTGNASLMFFGGRNPSVLRYDKTNSQIVRGLIDDSLYIYNTISKERKLLLSDVTDFVESENFLYTLSNVDEGYAMNAYTKNGLETIYKTIITTTKSPTFHTKASDSIVVVQYLNTVWIINHKDDKQSSFEARFIDYIKGKYLLANQFEVSYYDPTSGSTILLDRSEQNVLGIQWHPSGSYFLRILKDKLEIIEIDTRDRLNHHTVSTASTADYYTFDVEGKYLYELSSDKHAFYTIQ